MFKIEDVVGILLRSKVYDMEYSNLDSNVILFHEIHDGDLSMYPCIIQYRTMLLPSGSSLTPTRPSFQRH